MKPSLSDFPRKSQFPLLIAAGTLPLMALIILHNAPQAVSALAVLVPAYVLLAWLCLLLPGKIRLPAGVLSCAALLFAGLRLLPVLTSISLNGGNTMRVSQSAFALLAPLLLCAFLLHGLQFAAWPREQEIAFNWYAIGLLIHLAVQLVSYAERRRGSAAWTSIQPLLVASFIIFLLLAMLSMNRLTMHSAAQGRQYVPFIIRQRNTTVTVALLAGALLFAAVPALTRALMALWKFILLVLKTLSAAILAFLGDASAPSFGASGGGESAAFGMMEVSEPSLLAVILEKIAMTLALLAAAALFLLALRIIILKLAALLKALLDRLSRYAASASQDYVDEITDTREDGGQTEGTLRQRLLRRMAFVSEGKLTPTERIRYRYRRLLREHPDWHASRTARENLPSPDAALYEQARYSGQEATAEDAERFLRSTK